MIEGCSCSGTDDDDRREVAAGEGVKLAVNGDGTTGLRRVEDNGVFEAGPADRDCVRSVGATDTNTREALVELGDLTGTQVVRSDVV